MENWQRGRLIGRGSSAAVYLATNSSSGELFAVKSFKISNLQNAKKEQSILSSLNSPFIISYFGSDISRDPSSNQLCHNLFMEFAPGGSLSDEIKRYDNNKLDELSIRYHTYRILSGLSYLHNKNIIHCDIKGQNVLIDSNGRAKIADFGCAKYEFDNDQNTQFCGTPMYMAPEAARGEEQGKPADVWALGCMVIEMATGGVPWPGFSDPVSVLHHIGSSSEAPLFPDWISKQGNDFLSKCLNRDPKERWPAEKLLNHPFVASMENLEFEKDEIDDSFRVSPKSILDQGFWETSILDERTEVLERIGMLATGGESDGPDWTSDESNWISVRQNGNYEITTSGNTSEVDLIPTGDDFVSTGDDHEHKSHEFDFVNNNNHDLLLLEGSCGENEMIFLYFDYYYYCNNEYKSKKINEFILGSFWWWHNSLYFLVIFMID